MQFVLDAILAAVLPNFLGPALTTTIVLTCAIMISPRWRATRACLGGLAIALGSLSSFVLLGADRLQPWDPGQTWGDLLRPTTRWVAYLPLACIPILALERLPGRAITRPLGALLVAILSAYLIVPPVEGLDPPPPWTRFLVAGSIFALALALTWLADQSATTGAAAILGFVPIGAALLLVLAANEKMAQYVATCSAVMVVAALLALFADSSGWFSGMMSGYAALLCGWLWLGFITTGEMISWRVFLLAMLSPLGLAAACLPAFKSAQSRRRWLVSALAVLLPLGAAVIWGAARSTVPEALWNMMDSAEAKGQAGEGAPNPKEP